jgi:hypothetical protein
LGAFLSGVNERKAFGGEGYARVALVATRGRGGGLSHLWREGGEVISSKKAQTCDLTEEEASKGSFHNQSVREVLGWRMKRRGRSWLVYRSVEVGREIV